ncbi:cytochrome c oxidase subunit 2 [Natronoarchaeum philippinense]|uniref:cytochrome-c oxidase n=1 Tax=Natronoarchaeum philippinense TaxID=558529 RepID=A0A285MZC4_NATPI|nr:cytochrome c oxidase subunit II [Natronoarchaeum philippinense]SNZ02550.1 cytochrome c oxidase subunit 2 [Natronoarchaeum philippinense]
MVRARRIASAAVAVVVVTIVAATPVAAAPESITEELIRGLNRRLLYIAVPIAVLVEFILLYTIWRFHGNDEPEPTRTNRDLEITWTVATALVLLFVGAASFAVLTSPYVAAVPDLSGQETTDVGPPEGAPADAVVVEIVAEQWNYTYEYPDSGVTADEELVVPRNRTLYLYVTSEDTLHSVHVPELGLKQDAFPNQYNLIRTRVGERGQYRLYCAEFCGVGHAGMGSTLRVVEQDEYQRWLDRQNGTSGNTTANNRNHPIRP